MKRWEVIEMSDETDELYLPKNEAETDMLEEIEALKERIKEAERKGWLQAHKEIIEHSEKEYKFLKEQESIRKNNAQDKLETFYSGKANAYFELEEWLVSRTQKL